MAKTNEAAPTKMEAVRQALKELGKDAKPVDIQGLVKDRFGLTMTIGHISNCKSKILTKKARKGKGAAKSAAAKEPEPAVRNEGKPAPTPPAPAVPRANGISLGDIEAVKGLVERVGAEGLKKLVDLLAK